MKKSRIILTKFWEDNWVIDLDPVEKLLFIYLLTNPNTNLAGIYELHIRKMAFETGIDRDMIEKILQRFEKDGKIIYREGYVFIVNFAKNQAYNPSMKIHVLQILDTLPDTLKNDHQCTACVQGVAGCVQDGLRESKGEREGKGKRESKREYADFVKMTVSEYKKLVTEHGEGAVKKMIEILDNYKGSNGKKYKSDYKAILSWVVDKYHVEHPQPQTTSVLET